MSAIAWEMIPAFYHRYVQQVNASGLSEVFAQHATALPSLLHNLPDEQWGYKYAPGKWSIREVVQHVIDTERIFCYRALAFARGETIGLPGFDENAYAANADADRRSKEELLAEFDAVQRASAMLFNSLSPTQLAASGIANGNRIYVAGIGYIIAGHCLHHLNILKERYLSGALYQQPAGV